MPEIHRSVDLKVSGLERHRASRTQGTMEAVPTIPAPPAPDPENAEAAAAVPQRLWPPCSTGDPVAAGLANLTIPDVAEAPATLAHQPSLSTVVVPRDTERGREVNIPVPLVATPAAEGTLKVARPQQPQRHKQ